MQIKFNNVDLDFELHRQYWNMIKEMKECCGDQEKPIALFCRSLELIGKKVGDGKSKKISYKRYFLTIGREFFLDFKKPIAAKEFKKQFKELKNSYSKLFSDLKKKSKTDYYYRSELMALKELYRNKLLNLSETYAEKNHMEQLRALINLFKIMRIDNPLFLSKRKLYGDFGNMVNKIVNRQQQTSESGICIGLAKNQLFEGSYRPRIMLNANPVLFND